jgi:WbqC-like protein family
LIQSIAEHLGYKIKFVRSSGMPGLTGLTGQARGISICRRLGTKRYVNPIGGVALYDTATFRDHGIDLSFFAASIAPRPGDYPYLSIIHTLFCEGDRAASRGEGQIPPPPN